MAARPTRAALVIAAIRACGPLTRAGILEAAGMNRKLLRRYIERWVSTKWLTQVWSDEAARYAEGPMSERLEQDLTPRRKRHLSIDRSGDEASLEWYIVQQLSHGALSTAELVELTDEGESTVYSAIARLKHNGHIEHQRVGLTSRWHLTGKE